LSARARIAAWSFAFASVVGALAWSQANVDGSDLWWHLAAGRAYAEAGEVLRSDPFSHTAHGLPWINHEWLWDRVAWSAYHGHEEWLAWGHLALIAATFACVAARARRRSSSWLAACAAVWLAGAASDGFLDLRPQLITLFAVAALVATLGWRRAPWLWPPAFALWANLHGGYLFGLGVLGLYAIDATESAWSDPAARPRARRIWLGAIAATAAAGAESVGSRHLRAGRSPRSRPPRRSATSSSGTARRCRSIPRAMPGGSRGWSSRRRSAAPRARAIRSRSRSPRLRR
jgi:hypothetical protein